jgi:hypothetical protein
MKSHHLIESLLVKGVQLLADPRVWAVIATVALLSLAVVDEALQPGFRAPLVTP